MAQQRPYADWLKQEQIELSDLVVPAQVPGLNSDSLIPRMRAFGYTRESLDFMLIPLVHEERDPVGSMGPGPTSTDGQTDGSDEDRTNRKGMDEQSVDRMDRRTNSG